MDNRTSFLSTSREKERIMRLNSYSDAKKER